METQDERIHIALRANRAMARISGAMHDARNIDDPLCADEEVNRQLGIAYHTLQGAELGDGTSFTTDPGLAEAFAMSAQNLSGHLEIFDQTPLIKTLLPVLAEARAAGADAVRVILARRNQTDESDDAAVVTSNVKRILLELRTSIVQSNELTEDQKQDALGYVTALDAIMAMAHPDRTAFKSIVERLSEFASSISNIALMELVKELVKWGVRILLG